MQQKYGNYHWIQYGTPESKIFTLDKKKSYTFIYRFNGNLQVLHYICSLHYIFPQNKKLCKKKETTWYKTLKDRGICWTPKNVYLFVETVKTLCSMDGQCILLYYVQIERENFIKDKLPMGPPPPHLRCRQQCHRPLPPPPSLLTTTATTSFSPLQRALP